VNFLAHLYLSGVDPEILVGNFMGDFVKGRVGDAYPPRLKDGIVLHRRIDTFAQHHPLFHQSRQRLATRYGLYRGVLVDLFYDHFLALEWEQWSDEPLAVWLAQARLVVEGHRSYLPERLQGLVAVLFEELLPSYREVTGVGRALERMSRRVRRPNPLAGGEEELVLHYTGLGDDFRQFLPEAREFVTAYLTGDAAADS
jgi:acyl carrier protein phosphodiesterase